MARRFSGGFILWVAALFALASSGCGSTGTTSTSAQNDTPAATPMGPATGAYWGKAYLGVGMNRYRAFLQTSEGGYIATAGQTGASLFKLDDNGSIVWQYGFASTYGVYSSAVAQAGGGGYVMVGCVKTDPYNSGDLLVVKTNSEGAISWKKQYRNPLTDSYGGVDIKATADGGYIVLGQASYSNPGPGVSLMKLTGDGMLVWKRDFYDPSGGIWLDGSRVEQTSDNGFVVVGDIWPAGHAVSVIKVNADGSQAWWNQYVFSEGDTFGRGIRQTTDGGYILNSWTGGIVMRLDAGGSISWANKYSVPGFSTLHFRDIVQTPDGYFTAVGYLRPDLPGADSLRWIVRLNHNGKIVWQKSYRLPGYGGEAGLIQQTADGGYLTAGDAYPTVGGGDSLGIWVVKTRSDGSCGALDITIQGTYQSVTGLFETTPVDYLTIGTDLDTVSEASVTAGVIDIQTVPAP